MNRNERNKKLGILNKKLIKQHKKQTKIAFRIGDINREIWEIQLDNIKYMNWFNQLNWEYKGYKSCFEAYEIVSKQNSKENEIVRKMINWYRENKERGEDYLRLLYKRDTTMVAMALECDDDDFDIWTISIFAIDFNAIYVDQEINSKKLLKDFAEKFNINNVEKWN